MAMHTSGSRYPIVLWLSLVGVTASKLSSAVLGGDSIKKMPKNNAATREMFVSNRLFTATNRFVSAEKPPKSGKTNSFTVNHHRTRRTSAKTSQRTSTTGLPPTSLASWLRQDRTMTLEMLKIRFNFPAPIQQFGGLEEDLFEGVRTELLEELIRRSLGHEHPV
jgi:hypothetical protein